MNNAIAGSSRRTSTYLDLLVCSKRRTTNEKSTKETKKASPPPPHSCYFNVNCYQIILRYLKKTISIVSLMTHGGIFLLFDGPSKNTRLFWMRHSYTLTHNKKKKKQRQRQNSVVLSDIVDQCRFSSLVSRLPCKPTLTSLFYLGWPILRIPFGIVVIERTSACWEASSRLPFIKIPIERCLWKKSARWHALIALNQHEKRKTKSINQTRCQQREDGEKKLIYLLRSQISTSKVCSLWVNKKNMCDQSSQVCRRAKRKRERAKKNMPSMPLPKKCQ